MSGLRVLHVSQPAEAGVARVVLAYAVAQRAAGLDVVVACAPAEEGHLGRDLDGAGIVRHEWRAHRSPVRGLFAEIRRLRRIVGEVDPDVVHLHSSKAGLIGRLVVRGRRRTIFQPHAWSFDAAPGLIGVLSARWEAWSQRWTHHTVCVSTAERDVGRSRGVLDDAVVVPNEVDIAHWAGVDRDSAREALGIDRDAPLAVCVGRICDQKGQDVLVRRWAEVRTRRDGALLCCVGDGPRLAEWSARAGTGVRFVGADDPRAWYAAADVVVAPSRWEGMALVPLEAQAAGRPVVAASVAGMREVLTDGAVVTDDEDTLIEAIVQVLEDRSWAEDMGRRAREAAVARDGRRPAGAVVAALYTDGAVYA